MALVDLVGSHHGSHVVDEFSCQISVGFCLIFYPLKYFPCSSLPFYYYFIFIAFLYQEDNTKSLTRCSYLTHKSDACPRKCQAMIYRRLAITKREDKKGMKLFFFSKNLWGCLSISIFFQIIIIIIDDTFVIKVHRRLWYTSLSDRMTLVSTNTHRLISLT